VNVLPRRVGVLGTLVWDRIEHPVEGVSEGWGGIAYSLAAFSAALPPGWEAVPLVRVGADLETAARRFLEELPGVSCALGFRVVDEPTNRVRLLYRDPHQRDEVLTGGVRGWRFAELQPVLDRLDALYVNFISGFELTLEAARRLRSAVRGPLYADLHSLFLGDPSGAPRPPRRLENADAWVSSFDVVQVNEEELSLLVGDEDPRTAVERIAALTRLLVVTHGPAGAQVHGPGGRRQVPVPGGDATGDPTGCGDVWGATLFANLLRGTGVDAAVRLAHSAARWKLRHRGAEGLREHLGLRAGEAGAFPPLA
jgi:sugar/nucleoside kinase (ribokinase family)